jgi:hypothetical protein
MIAALSPRAVRAAISAAVVGEKGFGRRAMTILRGLPRFVLSVLSVRSIGQNPDAGRALTYRGVGGTYPLRGFC